MKAVILAAGEGTRLGVLSETRPKCLIYCGGKPIIHHLILEAKKAGIKEILLVVGHLKEQVIDYFSKNDLGIKITFITQLTGKGTGSAVFAAMNYVDDRFVVLAGDTVTESDAIKAVIENHEGQITIATKKVKNPHEYGVVEIVNGKVSMFEEKPQKPKTNFANLSIYCMEPTIFDSLKSIGKSARGEYEIVNLFLGAKAVVVDCFWKDIAYPWDLFEANEFLLEKANSSAGEIINSTINGKVIMEEGAKIIHSYVEGCCYIGKDTIIGPNAYLRGYTSIGKNCSIGSGSTVKNSIIFDNVNAKHLTYIGDSIIGSNVNFGSGTQIANFRFDEKNIVLYTERGWINTGRKKFGVIVGDNTKFGVLSCTMPGKIIGCNCWIHSGVIVNKNIPSNKKVFSSQPIDFLDV